MMMLVPSLLLLLLASRTEAHGYLKTPRSRNWVAAEDGLWWGGDVNSPAAESCPHCLNLGGSLAQCGKVGDHNYDYPTNAQGTPLPSNVQASYQRGQDIEVEVVLTAHHKGHFEFKACAIQEGQVASADCFEKLEFVEDLYYGAPKDPNFPERAYIPPRSYHETWEYKYKMKLPDEVYGELVLLQWYYVTANSCSAKGYNNYPFPAAWAETVLATCESIPPDGMGTPEQFWNCAEISIANGPVSPSAPVPAPTGAPVSTTQGPVSTPTAAPVSTTQGPVSTGTCGGGDRGNGVCADTSLCCSEWGYCDDSPAHCGYVANPTSLRPPTAPVITPVAPPTSAPVEPPTAAPVEPPTSAPVPPPTTVAGTCGGGSTGNGICADPALCCSVHGYCDDSPAHCGNLAPVSAPTVTGTCGGGSTGNGICADASLCCSVHGWCDNSPAHCGNLAPTSPPAPVVSPTTAPTDSPTLPPTTAPAPAPTDSPLSRAPPINNPTDSSCTSYPKTMTVNMGYYQSWAVWRNETCSAVFPLEIDVAGNGYTHLAYSFAGIDSTYSLEPMGGDYDIAQYVEFNSLKTDYPGLKTLIAVGGWSFNDPGPTRTRFSDMASTPERRKNFAKSAVDFCRQHGFDGVDLDWEYPGDPSRGGIPEDKQNLSLLVQAIRKEFDDAPEDFVLTMAIPVISSTLSNGYELQTVSQSLDFYALMAYDIHGVWDPMTDAHTDLNDIETGVNYLLGQGVPNDKIVLGLAAYGRTYKLSDPSCSTAGCPFSGAGLGGCGAEGYIPYFSIEDYISSGNHNPPRLNSDTSSMEFVVDGTFVSYDDPTTWAMKASFAKNNCLGGTMWWAVDMKKSAVSL